jgi:hypothetical protein
MPTFSDSQKARLRSQIREAMRVWEGRKSEEQLGLQLIITHDGEIHLFCRSIKSLAQESKASSSDFTAIIDQKEIQEIFKNAQLDPESTALLEPFLSSQRAQNTIRDIYRSAAGADRVPQRVEFGDRFNREVQAALERWHDLKEQNVSGKLQMVIGADNQVHLFCRSGTHEDTFERQFFDPKSQTLTINDQGLIASIFEQAHTAGEISDISYGKLSSLLVERKTLVQSSLQALTEISLSPSLPKHSDRIPEHVKCEPIILHNEIDESIRDAMKEWVRIAKNKGKPRLQLITNTKGEIILTCLEQSQLKKLQNSIDDPNEIALRLAQADLSKASCQSLAPFVESVEKNLPKPRSFTRFIRSAFSQDPEAIRKALYHLKPESKHAEGIFGVRGVLYQKGELTGEQGSAAGNPCCNDWVGMKANGTIGVIDGPAHGRPELPKRYFAFYQEIFNTFDRLGEQCRETYEDNLSMRFEDLQQFCKTTLEEGLKNYRIEMYTMAEQDVMIAAEQKQALIDRLRAAKERFFSEKNEPTNEELIEFAKQLYDEVDTTRLEGSIRKFEANNTNILSKDSSAAGDERFVIGNLIMIEYFQAIKDKNYQRLIEIRKALIYTKKEPNDMTLIRAMISEKATSAGVASDFSSINEQFLLRDLFNTLTQVSEAMLPSTDRMSCPAVAFAKVMPTREGLFLLKLQAADATSLTATYAPSQTSSTIDTEHAESAGFGGHKGREDTRVVLERVTPGQIVSVQTDGVTDFIGKDALTEAVVQSPNPEALFNHLAEGYYAPEKPIHSAVAKPSGRPNEMKPLDPNGIKPSEVDDFSCARMRII